MNKSTPADTCDFARYCSALDFFALTDHAETLTPRQWSENKRVLRQCSAVGQDGNDQDLITFTGFEWTQAGTTRDNHYGHRNVIFRDQDEARLPPRAISPMPPYFDPDLPVLTKMHPREPRVGGYVIPNHCPLIASRSRCGPRTCRANWMREATTPW